MLKIIRAYADFVKLHSAIQQLDGGIGISASEYKGLWDLFDVIQNNSSFNKNYNDESDTGLMEILWNRDMTAEEKYNIIIN